MTNLYSTTLGIGYAITGCLVTYTGMHTFEPLLGPGIRNRKNISEAKKNDYSGEKNVKVLADGIQLINPKEEIRVLKPSEANADRIIIASKNVDDLELPQGCTKTPNGFTSYNDDAGNPVEIYVVNSSVLSDDQREALEDKLQPKLEREKIEIGKFKYAATTIGTSLSTTIIDSVLTTAYADTYDAKAYMDALSDDQLIELATDLENTSTSDLDQMLIEVPEETKAKTLVK